MRNVGRGGAPLSAGAGRGNEGVGAELARGNSEAGPGDPPDKGCALPSPESALREVPGPGRPRRLRRGLSASLEGRMRIV